MITLRAITLLVTFVLLITLSSFAQELYISNEPQASLQILNLNTQPAQLTTLYHAAGKLDDLTLNAAGQLIYSIPSLGEVHLYDPATGIDTAIVTGLKYARDLAIEPGGQTMLIAVYSPGQIVRFNFATGLKTVLVKKLKSCDGIAYDPYGNLYAVANHNTIIQVDPVTGAILNTLVLEPHQGVNGGDGLTYDSYTNSLWATHDGTTGNGLLQMPVTPAGISSFAYYPLSGVNAPDGIKSDGQGNLYIGALWAVAVYNIPTNTNKNYVVKGADGVSLVPGSY